MKDLEPLGVMVLIMIGLTILFWKNDNGGKK